MMFFVFTLKTFRLPWFVPQISRHCSGLYSNYVICYGDSQTLVKCMTVLLLYLDECGSSPKASWKIP